MGPKRTREALDHFEVATPETLDGQPGVFVAPLNLDETVQVFEAASWAVDLFEECENCGGEGEGELGDRQPLESHIIDCPACGGRGYILNRERRGRAIDATWKAWRDARPETATSAWTPGQDLLAEAAILAFLLEGPNSD